MAADPSMTWAETTETMKKMCSASWEDDKAVVSWIQNSQVGNGLLQFVSCILDICAKQLWDVHFEEITSLVFCGR